MLLLALLATPLAAQEAVLKPPPGQAGKIDQERPPLMPAPKGGPAADEPTRALINLSAYKDVCRQYYDSGVYMTEIAEVAGQARRALAERVAAKKPGEKLAVVFDIDETSLSNWTFLEEEDFSRNAKLWAAWIDKKQATAIRPVLELYQAAEDADVAVFFITGRRESLSQPTVQNLVEAGYTKWDGLSLCPDDYENPSVVPYKSAAREAIEDKGYTIIINIGDQWSDLEGGHAERTYKLPDPFYFIP